MFKFARSFIINNRKPLAYIVGCGGGGLLLSMKLRQSYRFQRLNGSKNKNDIVQLDLNSNFGSSDILAPNPDGDTYEMGLYLSSKREKETQVLQERQAQLNQCPSSILKLLLKIKFKCQDNIVVPIHTMIRFLELMCFVLLPIFLTYPIVTLSLMDKILWYRLIRSLCQYAGPSFIKLGQWASARNDLFSNDFCHVMSALHSNVKPHPIQYSIDTLCDLFQIGDLYDVFESFDAQPIGCGSIAQVHKARWKHNDNNSSCNDHVSNEVAIKILHPNVVDIINTDLRIMETLANLISMVPTMEWLSLTDEVRNFSIFMNMQLDLRIEAMNLDKFNRDFQNDPLISFPKPLLQYTTKTVLFEEYINALPMEQLLNEKNNLNDIDIFKVSHPFVMAFLNMMIINNFVHADLHPGNVMIRFMDKSTEKINDSIVDQLSQNYGTPQFTDTLKKVLRSYIPQICFIDAGLVTELNNTNRINFMDLFQSLTKFDGYQAGRLMIDRSRIPSSVIDPLGFSQKVQTLVTQIKIQTFSLGSISIGNLLNEMLSMVRQHHVKMEADFVSIVVAILLLEGIGRQLDPNLDLFESSIPLLSQYYREKYSLLKGKEEINDNSLLNETKSWQMMVIWLGLQTRRFLSMSLRQTDILLKSDQLSPDY